MSANTVELDATLESAEAACKQWMQHKPTWSNEEVRYASEALSNLAVARSRCRDIEDHLSDSKLKVDDTLRGFKAP